MKNLSKLQKLHDQHQAIWKQIIKESKKAFKEGSKDLFIKYPHISKFSWSQYTPYFADGDECVFGACTDEDSIEIDGQLSDELDLQDYINGKYVTKPGMEMKQQAYEDISSFLGEFSDEVLKTIFGDHVKVIVGLDKTEVESYEHD